MSAPNLGFATVACGPLTLMLWIHTAEDPSEDEWSTALKKVSSLKDELGGDVSRLRGIAVTDGGAPNALQRQVLFVELLEGNVKSSAVSTVLKNPLKRGITTAISWLNPNFRAFPPDQVLRALKHLDVADHAPAIYEHLDQLETEMGVSSESLQAIRDSLV